MTYVKVDSYMRTCSRLFLANGRVNVTALAHDATAHFALWENGQNVPAWVTDIADTIRRQERFEHLCQLLGVQFPPDTDDGMTAEHWQEIQRNREARNTAEDDAQAHRI